MQYTIDFLNDLKDHNNREWFNENKTRYEQAHNEMITFSDALIQEMNAHDVLVPTTGKKCLFRIYRDTRFSKDKTPYKTTWQGRFQREGVERRGGYYFQVAPKESVVLGGFFGPNAQDMLHIRKQIAADPEPLRSVIQSESFKDFFGSLMGDQVKSAPRGFTKDHPEIDLLKYKQLLVRHAFTNEEVHSKEFPAIVSHAFEQMRPFLDVMTMYLTTDLNGEPLL